MNENIDIKAIDRLIAQLSSGNNKAISQAITLIESKLPLHIKTAKVLLERLQQRSFTRNTLRIGISGIPGVGKSSLIAQIGSKLLLSSSDLSLGVLTIDPSSTLSGGSILGDKVRMSALSAHKRAYIRSSPNLGNMGGIGIHTYETILLLEAADYNIILVESVGTGQSEYTLSQTVDCFILVKMPGSGDDIQTYKKGINEMANMVVINRDDGDQKLAAQELYNTEKTFYSNNVPVILTSAKTGSGCSQICDHLHTLQKKDFTATRNQQSRYWFNLWLQRFCLALLDQNNNTQIIKKYAEGVVNNKIPARVAASKAIGEIFL